jgi:hypothetical protein
MAFSDPQVVTISAGANDLHRVGAGKDQSWYRTNNGLVTLSASHQYGKRVRRNLRLDHSKVAANPFDSTLNAKYSMSTYIVFDVPVVGYTVADQKAVWDGFHTYLGATSGAIVSKLLGGES